MTTIYGIFGWPVAHSLSPAMHNAAFHALDMDSVYVPFAVPPEQLKGALQALVALDIRGVNLTLPHKHNVLPLLDEIEPSAQLIGAVNCVSNVKGRLLGSNTDAPGLVHALLSEGIEIKNKQVTMVGAGGAARAAIVGLAEAGASTINLLARRIDQAKHLVMDLQTHIQTQLIPHDLQTVDINIIQRTELLIQASSATLHNSHEAQTLIKQLHVTSINPAAVIVDLAYGPHGTPLTRAAKAQGLAALDGMGMLLHQGVLAFERWTNERAPLDAMKAQLPGFSSAL